MTLYTAQSFLAIMTNAAKDASEHLANKCINRQALA